MSPPQVSTATADWNSATRSEVLHGSLKDLGNAAQVKVGFQYRVKKDGTDLSERTEPWIDLPAIPKTSTGEFTYTLRGLTSNRDYEFRAEVKHPLLTVYGQETTFRTAQSTK
jgi:alpha-L-fucosidase